MTNISYKILLQRQKTHIKAYAVLCIIVLVVMGFYSYKKWMEYSLASTGVEKNKELIDVLKDQTITEKTSYESQKNSFDTLNEDAEEKLGIIFPSEDNYTALTRQIDLYEKELATRNDTFEIANIDYQDPIEGETYSILPLRMNIKSSSENFTKFLHMVENSGSIDEEVRLMDISSIRLTFEKDRDDPEKENITFSVQINAYFQK